MDKFYIGYFLVHILTTVAVDSAIALPEKWTFPFQTKMLDMHMSMNNDPLIAASPIWLRAFVWVEIVLQTPFFFWAAHDLYKNKKRVYPAIVAYGVEASTTTLACLAEIAFNNTLATDHKVKMLGLYIPYLLIPLLLAVDFSRRIISDLNSAPKLKGE